MPVPTVPPPPPEHPTADQIRERIVNGQAVELPTPNSIEIPAAWIEAIADTTKGVVAKSVIIRNARITGDLKLRYVEFQSDVCFTGCHFSGEVDFSFCVFAKAAVFDGSCFDQTVRLNGTSTRADFEWTGTKFRGDFEGRGLTVALSLYAQGAEFNKCVLQGASVRGHALFKEKDTLVREAL